MGQPEIEPYDFQTEGMNDPIWESDALIFEMQQADDPSDEWHESTPYIRNHSGVMEFLNDVVEEVREAVQDASPVYAAQELAPVAVQVAPCQGWRARSATVTTSSNQPLVVNTKNRRRITFVNLGPQVVWVSHQSNAQAGSPNCFPIQVTGATLYAPLTLETVSDVYAVTATASSTLTFVEEFA